MNQEKIVVLVGSTNDLPFAHRIEDFLREERFPLDCEYRVNSAHRNVEKLLNDLKSYEHSKANIVYITVAGLSDALSGVVAGYTMFPVIACPPDVEKQGFPKVFSTMMTPKGVAVSLVSSPDNAALTAAKILALSNTDVKNRVNEYINKMRAMVAKADTVVIEKEEYVREREHVTRNEHLEHGEHVEHSEDT